MTGETELTESKLVYPEFKFWKNIYTSINKADAILFMPSGEEDALTVLYSTPGAYYYLEGGISGNTEFIKWVNQTSSWVAVSLESLNQLRSVLKKNAVKVKYNSVSFEYTFLDKDGEERKIILQDSSDDESLRTIVAEGIKLKSRLTKQYPISLSILKEEICEIFINQNGELSTERTKNKLLEIPSSRILAIQKSEDTEYVIKASDRDEYGHRLVAVNSISKESGLSFLQVFNTI